MYVTMCASIVYRVIDKWCICTVSQTADPNPFRGTHCSSKMVHKVVQF